MTDTLPPRTHNLPPIVAPLDAEMLADLQARYPEVAKELDAFEAALKTYPERLTLKDAETAAALQDLLGKMAKQKAVLAGLKKHEKKPWDTLVKVVQNFFGKGEEKIDGWLGVWKPRFQEFLDLKEADNRAKAEAEAERQRAEAVRLEREAEEAAERKRKAEAEEAEAWRREEEALAAAARAEEERRQAEARAAEAKAEEERRAKEKRERDKAERDQNTEAFRAIRRNMKDAERLHLMGEGDEATEDEIAQLDGLVRAGGVIGNLAAPVAASMLLDDEQKIEIETIRGRLGELRKAANGRHDAKEQRRRERERKAAEAAEAAAAAERAARRRAEDEEHARAKAAREKADAEALALKEAEKAAKGDVRAARADARDAVADQKTAARDEKRLDTDSDRAANRAGRMERRIENSTDADFSRTRGDLGTVGGLTGHWAYSVTDRDALLAKCGPLAAFFTEDAVDGAVYRWMRAHQGEFTGERIEGRLPGCVFMWTRDVAIRA